MSMRGDVSVVRPMRAVEPKEKTADDAVLTEVWEAMRPRLAECIKRTLRNVLFFSHATNIQKMTIPAFCREGVSVRVEASTGSGKTLAFLLPLVHRLVRRSDRQVAEAGLPVRTKKVSALVLSPSRTLSRQTFIICRQLVGGADHNLRTVTWGDTKATPEKDLAAYHRIPAGGGNIVVATPASVVEILRFGERSGKAKHRIEFADDLLIVVDEADVVLDKQMGVMNSLLSFCQHSSIQWGLFGATVTSTAAVADFVQRLGLSLQPVPKAIVDGSLVPIERDEDDNIIDDVEDIREDAAAHAGKMYTVEDETSTLINLRNCHVFVPAKQSMSALIYLLNKHPRKKHFVFFNNAEVLEYVSGLLADISSDAERSVLWQVKPYMLHPGVSEMKRSERFKQFLSDPKGVLMCTDECAFGIDVREVDYVLHFQPPRDQRIYTHRIGRTGRMGCRGTSVLMLPAEAKATNGPFLAQLQETYSTEEMRLPGKVFDATALVGSVLATNEGVRDAAVAAACVAVQQCTDREDLSTQLCILGLDERLAASFTAMVEATPSEAPAAPAKRKAAAAAKGEHAAEPAKKKKKVVRVVKKKKAA
eukprot:TRINITY_DN16593_c0_g1_i1.p2 TRINITY_DN16593_c0_g1~~TRINITY_DN16593_c0_g1_i1.p2  ORF type:complete len:590 (+),score=253.35 TRINITY_DN16593_c0_g1_i1:69-1838(+)